MANNPLNKYSPVWLIMVTNTDDTRDRISSRDVVMSATYFTLNSGAVFDLNNGDDLELHI